MLIKSAKTTKTCALLPLTVAIMGMLFVLSAQAVLPTPLAVISPNVVDEDSDDANLKNQHQNNLEHPNNQSQEQKNQNLLAKALLNQWRAQVQASNLAQHTTWRRLLYFVDDNQNIFIKNKNSSLINNPTFFLSAQGQQDSGAELDAMLVALADTITQTTSQTPIPADSVLCRFPARSQWLSDTLGIDDSNLQAPCPELDAWMNMLAPDQLSVMFAQEYLDNPISAFAHTLLRIDSAASVANPQHIHHAYALNDTLDGNPDDPFALYAIKAISGRYNHVIEIDPYPKKLLSYLQEDERDVWTYRLDLSPAEVRQMILHVWETKELHTPYYFMTDNCASEILRLIDVVRPQQHLFSKLPYAVIPADVIMLLDEQQLLTKTTFTPSDDTVRQAQLNQANAAAALGYQTPHPDDIKNIKSATINQASSMTADKRTLLPLTIGVSDNNPLERHALQRVHVSMGQRGENRYIDMGIRAGFQDSLERPVGYPQFFDLEALSATLRFYDTNNQKDNQPSRVTLQNATLLRGRSFNPINTAKKGSTWGASIEATRINDGAQVQGRDHLVGSGTFEYGKSWAFGTPRTNAAGVLTGEMPPQLCYGFATGMLQAGRGIHKGMRVGAGINAGCRYQMNARLRVQTELQLPYWYHGDSNTSNVQDSHIQDNHIQDNYWQPISTFGLQYDIDKNQALRLNARYDWQKRVADNEDISLSYMRYF